MCHTSYKRAMKRYFKYVKESMCFMLYIQIKISCKMLFQICREGIAETPCPIWSRLLMLTSSKNRDPTAWNGFQYDVLGKLSWHQYNEWCQYRKKTFQSFYARRHKLINIAFMFYIVDEITKSSTHVTKLDYPAEMTDYKVSIENDFVMVYLQVFIPIYDEKTMKNDDETTWCINVY